MRSLETRYGCVDCVPVSPPLGAVAGSHGNRYTHTVGEQLTMAWKASVSFCVMIVTAAATPGPTELHEGEHKSLVKEAVIWASPTLTSEHCLPHSLIVDCSRPLASAPLVPTHCPSL